MLPNPNYKGEWKAPMIEHPLWKKRGQMYIMPKIRYIGVDVWQVRAGAIFDNFFVGNNIDEFEEFANRTFLQYHEEEIKLYEREQKRLHDKSWDDHEINRRQAHRQPEDDEPPPDD